jgi:hypothetical protein
LSRTLVELIGLWGRRPNYFFPGLPFFEGALERMGTNLDVAASDIYVTLRAIVREAISGVGRCLHPSVGFSLALMELTSHYQWTLGARHVFNWPAILST